MPPAALAPFAGSAEGAASPLLAFSTLLTLSARPTGTAVFVSGREGYDAFRIPALVRARGGALLAFAEGRVAGAADSGNIDLVLKRSEDIGRTWGPLRVVGNGAGNVFGNPAPVVDRRTGRVILLSTHNAGEVSEAEILRGEATGEQSRRVFVQESGDDGVTWSAPREITAEVKPPDWRWYATGPVHGIQLERGPDAGRLVIPANHSTAPPGGSGDTGGEARYYGAHALYSDDGGATWRLGAVDDTYGGHVNANESTAVELVDGRIYLNARNQNGASPETRAVASSGDGGRCLVAPYAPEPGIVAPVVQGSVLRLSAVDRGARENRLLFSAPSNPEARERMAVRGSLDEARTWNAGSVVWEGPSAYSDMVRLSDRACGLLYEAGTNEPYEGIFYAALRAGGGLEVTPR